MYENNEPRRRIGFRFEDDIEPMQQLCNESEEEQENSNLVQLDDYIPGAVYDANGNIVTNESFMANVNKTKAEAKSLRRNSLAKLILYGSISASLMLLSYGIYKKHLTQKQNQIENVQQKQR